MRFSAIKFCGALLSLLLSAVLACAQSTAPINTAPIYNDGFQAPWFSNPAGANVNPGITNPVKVGTHSISVVSKLIGGEKSTSLLQIGHPVKAFDTTPYRALTFWINGGTLGGQKLKLALMRGIDEIKRVDLSPPQAENWSRVAIALSDLGIADNPVIDGIRLIEEIGSGKTFYLDDIQLTTETVPTLAATIYDDVLRGRWSENKLGATLNFSNTTTVFSGAHSLSVNTPAYQAAQLIHPYTDFNTAPYQSLSFQIHGGTAGNQNLRIAALTTAPGKVVEGPRILIWPKPTQNAWSAFAIALEDLGVDDIPNLHGFRIWESGGVASTYYLDDLRFDTQTVPSLRGIVFEEALLGAWLSNPFNATVNTTNTDPVKDGYKSIACTITSAGGTAQFSLSGTPPFDASAFTSVSFWIHGGGVGNQQIAVSLKRKSGATSPSWTIPAPAANTWTQHTISLRELGADGATDVTALWFRSQTTGAQPVFYLDNVRFDRPSGFAVTYQGNGHTGGTVPVDASNHDSGSTVTLSDNTGNLTRGANFNFTGWNSAADGTGTAYTPGANVVIKRNLVLYAQWNYTGPTYALTYDGNGHNFGAVPVDAGSPYIPAKTVTVANAPTLSRTGHTFGGWNTAANGTGTTYAAGTTFAIAQATTLYAKWTPSAATYSVVYQGNDPNSGTAPVDYASPRPINDLVIIADKANLVKTNEPFLGWNTAADGSGTRYFPGDRVRITANLTLYAQYGAFRYPYEPYNQLQMDPQLTGWPISPEARNYVLNKTEEARRPGLEVGHNAPQKMQFFPVTPVAAKWGTSNGVDPKTWFEFHTLLVDKVAATPDAEILLVGDSITSQWGGGQTKDKTQAWVDNFGETPFVNLGIGGDKTYNVLWRLDRANLVRTFDHDGTIVHQGIDPKVVVLQIGHNNMFFAALNNVQYAANYGIEDAVNGIVWCVRNLRSKFPTTPIILVNVFPTLKPFYDELKATRAALNARNLAATDPLVFELDLWDQLNLQPPGLGNPDYFKPLHTDIKKSDGVHLTADGYQVWAAALKPLIDAINAPTVRYDANGASSGSVPAATVYANRDTVTLRANSGTLAKSGYTFTGWNTRPDGSGTHYLANGTATFTITAPTTLYATWVPSSSVRFTRNVVDAVIVDGQTATFSVAISGATEPSFQWQRATALDPTNFTSVGDNTTSLEVAADSVNHGDRYRVVVSTVGSTDTSTSLVGAVQVLPAETTVSSTWKYTLPSSFTAQTHTDSTGLSLGYRLFSPPSSVTPPTSGYPLVVVLPGKDDAGKPMLNLAAARFVAEQTTNPCHILVPICPLGKEWSKFVKTANSPFQTNQTHEMRLLRGALDALQASSLPIDDNRLYLVGFNQGGYAVWDLLQREGNRWAAAVPVLGGGDSNQIGSVKDTLPPIWAAHSWHNNNLVPVDRTRVMVSAVQKVRPSILYSEYNRILLPFEDFIRSNPALTQWMFAQVRGVPEVPFATVAGSKALPPWNQCADTDTKDKGPIPSYADFFRRWKQYRDAWEAATDANQQKVVFIGDSITDGWSSLSTDLPKFNGNVLNMGISGDMSRGVLTRIQDVIAVNPKAVSLLIGTNDITFYGPNTEAIATIAVNNVKAIIQALRAHRANLPIIVSTVMPKGDNRVDSMNTQLKTALAGMPSVWICDVNDRFTKNPGGYRGLYVDDVHPNADGYQVWAEELDKVFAAAGLYASETPTNARAWDGGGTNTLWSTPANWNTLRDGTGGDPDSSPSTGQIAVFNTSVLNSLTTVTLSGNVTVEGIEVINSDATRLFTDGLADRILTVGAGGIELKAGAGGLQLAENNTTNKKIKLILSASQAWTNNGGLFKISSDSAPNINLGAHTLTLGGSGDFELPGRITGAGGIVKIGTGSVTLHNATSSFTGPLTLQNGIWEAKNFANVNLDSDLGKGSATSTPADLILAGGTLRHSFANAASTDRLFTLGSSHARTGTLDSSAADPTHTLRFTDLNGELAYGGTGTRTLRLAGTNTGENWFYPSIGNGPDAEATSLVKLGTGRWILAGASTYTGTTRVNAGTLAITGSLGNTAVTVAAGATLTGKGSIGGSVTVANGGRLLLDVATTPAGQQALRLSGNLDLTAGHVVELKVPTNVTPGSYTLVRATGGITDSLGSVQISGPAGTLKVVSNNLVFTISHFDLWCAANAITGAAADVNTEAGRTHFFNYAFGLNPTAGGRGLLIDTAGLPTLGKISYTRRKPASSGLSYEHQYSTDLKDWQTFTPVTLVTNSGDPVESVTVELPTEQRDLNRIFIRVRASAP